jgi:hypothetical protein
MKKMGTYIQPGDNGDDANNDIHLMWRPADGERGIDHFNDDRDAL